MPCIGFAFVVVAAPAAAGVGFGVLVVNGIMWAGERLWENYESACQEWSDLVDAARAEQMRYVTSVEDLATVVFQRGANLVAPGTDSGRSADEKLAALLANLQTDGGHEPGTTSDDAPESEAVRMAGRALAMAEDQLQRLYTARLLSLRTTCREIAELGVPEAGLLGERVEVLLGQGIARVSADVRELEEAVVGLAQRGQRDRVAHAIAATLRDLGYRSIDGEEPGVQVNGDFADVSGLRPVPGSEPGNRGVSFQVGLDGGVRYDLTGYAGNDAQAPANELFEAFRDRGLVMLDAGAMELLENVPAKQLTEEELAPHHYKPGEGHKDQALIAERVVQLLGGAISRSASGTIDIEGSNGRYRYRVEVPPHSLATVLRDELDVSSDMSDKVADAARSSAAGEEAAALAESRQRVNDSLKRRRQVAEQQRKLGIRR